MNKNLVSVIIPTRNRCNLLDSAIKSVMEQEYPFIEIIIVNDNSNDGTISYLEQYQYLDNIIIITLNKSVGGAEARNIGIKKAKGYYIAFLDDDDVWHPNKISRQIDILNRNDNIAIVSCSFKKKSKIPIIGVNKKIINLDQLLFENHLGSFSFCMIKRDSLTDIQIDKSLDACQDWDLWINILERTNKNAYIINDKLVIYNDDDHDRISNQIENKYRATLKFIRLHHNKLNQTNIYFILSNIVVKRGLSSGNNIIQKYGYLKLAIKLRLLSNKKVSLYYMSRTIFFFLKSIMSTQKY